MNTTAQQSDFFLNDLINDAKATYPGLNLETALWQYYTLLLNVLTHKNSLTSNEESILRGKLNDTGGLIYFITHKTTGVN